MWAHLECWKQLEACPTPGCGSERPAAVSISESRDLFAWAEDAGGPRALGARLPIRARLFLSLFTNLAILAVLVAVLGYVAYLWSDPAAKWTEITSPRWDHSNGYSGKPDFTPLGAVCTGLFYGGLLFVATLVTLHTSGRWVLRWPITWRRTTQVLRRRTPIRMLLTVWTDSNSSTYAEFTPPEGGEPLKTKLVGVSHSLWLRRPCVRQPVLVYSQEDEEPPFLVENEWGDLSLLFPNWAS